MATNYTRTQRTNPHKVHARSMSRGRLVEGSGTALASNPLKTDTPENTMVLGTTVADLSAHDPNEPTRVARSEPWKSTAKIISARSKRELRQLIQAQQAGAGDSVISNIQVNDQGLYFVYTNTGGGA